MTYGLIVVCLFVCVLIMCMVLVTMSDCLSMLFLVVTNFRHISISVLSTLSIKGRVILSDSEIIPIKLILTEALTATGTSSRRDVCAVLQSNYLSAVAVIILEHDG